MQLRQVALVSELKKNKERIPFGLLSQVSAAIQRQASRDLSKIWDIEATVDAFEKLEDVPLGYWPIMIMDDIHEDAAGLHEDKNHQPFALVQYADDWTLTVSHETLEMLVDPYGTRLVPGFVPDQAIKAGAPRHRVEFLVEVCDPSEDGKYGYTQNGFLVSDFYTPNFFDPVKASGVRYSFTGAITEPRQILSGGYISWHDPKDGKWYQFTNFDSGKVVDLGAKPAGVSPRRFTDSQAIKMNKLLTKAANVDHKTEELVAEAAKSDCKSMKKQIDDLFGAKV